MILGVLPNRFKKVKKEILHVSETALRKYKYILNNCYQNTPLFSNGIQAENLFPLTIVFKSMTENATNWRKKAAFF